MRACSIAGSTPARDLSVDHALITQMRDVVGRIAELIDLFARADMLLARILPRTLTRDALGFSQNETQNEGETPNNHE